MNYTQLSTILNDMNRWKDIANIEEQFKVRAIDAAIRAFRKVGVFPWSLKKGTIRIFDDIKTYPVNSDHDEIAYIERQDIDKYADSLRFFNTSQKQFFQDVASNRNLLTEIWDLGTKYLGVNLKDFGRNITSQLVDTAETVANYSVSDDADSVVLDNVVFRKGNGSMKVAVTESAGVATIEISPSSFGDSDYKRKYYFQWVYLDSAPTSVTLRLGNDSSNFLYGTVAAQFSGQAFKADDWNLLAFDLNDPTGTIGSIDSAAFDYAAVILTGAATGTYYIDQSNIRGWELLDYWYYSINNIKTELVSVGDQEFFYLNEAYSTADSLIGDKEWADVISAEALMDLITDIENVRVFARISTIREAAWSAFADKYPDMVPVPITIKHRFRNDFNTLDY